MKVVFFGLGSIGERHVRILKKYFNHELFSFRSNPSLKISDKKISPVYSWEEIDAIKPDVATITNPTSLHIETAIECARRGMSLFIEKPLGVSVVGLKSLLRMVERNRLSSYVAYVLRFHPVIKTLKKYVDDETNEFLHMRVIASSYLPNWRSRVRHLDSYSARSRLGGGAIFDLSHELDYTKYILGNVKKIQGRFEKRSDVTVDAEDYADILVDTERGPASIHINFLSQHHRREITIDFKGKSVVGDLVGNAVMEFRNGRLVKKLVFRNSMDDCHRRQFQYFFRNIVNRKMMNNIFEASELFTKIVRFKSNGSIRG